VNLRTLLTPKYRAEWATKDLNAAIEREIESAVEEEREACARLCDKRAEQMKHTAASIAADNEGADEAVDEAGLYDADAHGATKLAKAIRARKP